MANTDDEEFLNHLTDDEGVQLRKVPCARVTTTDIAEHMGISHQLMKNGPENHWI